MKKLALLLTVALSSFSASADDWLTPDTKSKCQSGAKNHQHTMLFTCTIDGKEVIVVPSISSGGKFHTLLMRVNKQTYLSGLEAPRETQQKDNFLMVALRYFDIKTLQKEAEQTATHYVSRFL